MCHHTRSAERRTDYARRAFLRGLAAAATVGATAGCLGDDPEPAQTEPPDPVSLGGGKACDACGMVIADHGGPSGQVFYAGDHPPDRDGPAWYDSLAELVIERDATADRGREPIGTYVTDYAAVDYEIRETAGDRIISSHVAPDAFVRWDEAVYAVETGVVGAMGPDLLPFSDRGAAESFVEAEGGRLVKAGAVTADLVSSL